ncbi:MAG TPA: helix-turn-helix transcriptional regulator [Candidatus Aveggerthella stercoripullorum]|uniref:Helix-turn-helix transcriptional regulator n=1 Tax=Candidatus Aveggerthella stercoripullorum TaxID=2840688 RepID=A0A9D1D2Q9_9ACTN|nr:helix-turn-helix transcriptional regulator [Candidatus Aveggerthella stercoripullorum]
MEAVLYVLAIAVITVCVAASCMSFSAFAVSRRKMLLFLAAFFLFYALEQMAIFYNEYLTQNRPFQVAAFGSMEDVLLRLLLGVGMCQSLWMAFCAFFNETRRTVRYLPAVVFVAVSVIILLVPTVTDQVQKWAFYSVRSGFLLWMVLFSVLEYRSTDADAIKARYKRKLIWLVAFAALVACTFAEDTVVMLLLDPNVVPFETVLQYLYRRNTSETILVMLLVAYAIYQSFQALELKVEEAPSASEKGFQAQARDLLPYFSKRHGLTPREQEILSFVVDGADNFQIARELQLAVGTVKTHVHNIFKKTESRSREELIRKFWAEE